MAEVSNSTCTVACRLPNGLQVMLYDMIDHMEAAPGGMQRIKRAQARKMTPIILNGFSTAQNRAPKHEIRDGFGLTFGVPAAPMKEWLEMHKDQDYVKNGLIFIQDGRREIEAQIRDHVDQKSGLERIDPRDKKALGKGIQAADKK